MKLLGVEKRNNGKDWLCSEWALTYRVGWEQIVRSASLIWRYTKDPEIITGDAYGEAQAVIREADDVQKLEESGWLTVRGTSEILKVPVMITFFNQTDLVRVTVAAMTEEFAEADYRRFNLSMCQFMDSAEIAMYG